TVIQTLNFVLAEAVKDSESSIPLPTESESSIPLPTESETSIPFPLESESLTAAET
ncbi:hypothetical protein A2U01_0018819, partial [Trifolium medium]|nr:hypothetical protein [Trifolium medium]